MYYVRFHVLTERVGEGPVDGGESLPLGIKLEKCSSRDKSFGRNNL